MSNWSIDLKELVKYAHASDACIDLVCCQTSWVPAYGTTQSLVPTGIAVEFPTATFGLILPRSSLAQKYHIAVLGGVIDNGYRGEIMVNLINHGLKGITFAVGDRIAQLAILPYYKVSLEWSKELSDTDRGESGHGSTGS
jgi:dUTP pyrophosphatase